MDQHPAPAPHPPGSPRRRRGVALFLAAASLALSLFTDWLARETFWWTRGPGPSADAIGVLITVMCAIAVGLAVAALRKGGAVVLSAVALGCASILTVFLALAFHRIG